MKMKIADKKSNKYMPSPVTAPGLSPFGEILSRATLKAQTSDFKVTELPKHMPVGEGEHLWVWVRKENANTDWVAGELAKQAALSKRNVGYAGRKDRFAVTQQWFSLYDPKRKSDETVFDIPGCVIVKKIRHQQKLRTGHLLGNYFEIVLRDLNSEHEEIEKRLRAIQALGFPNYFGAQRFGRMGDNVQQAVNWIDSGAKRIKRNLRSLYISSLRSYIFNQILELRVQQNNWNTVLKGDLVQLAGSRSRFLVEDLATEQVRCEAFDICPTAVLMGKTKFSPEQVPLNIERNVIDTYPKIEEYLLKQATGDRRPLRAVPINLLWDWQAKDRLELKFSLTAGSYATVLLEQCFELSSK